MAVVMVTGTLIEITHKQAYIYFKTIFFTFVFVLNFIIQCRSEMLISLKKNRISYMHK